MKTFEIVKKFEEIIEVAKNCDAIETCVIGLLMYADHEADTTDKENFIIWLEQKNGRGLMDINTMTTKPHHYFKEASDQTLTWDWFEGYYLKHE